MVNIQLITWPPKQMPIVSASEGGTIWCITTRVAAWQAGIKVWSLSTKPLLPA